MMPEKFKFEGAEYSTENLSEGITQRFLRLQFVQQKLQELQDNSALLNKAKNGYIEDLKNEIVSGKLGVDLGDLLAD
jgi:hypothetical protein